MPIWSGWVGLTRVNPTTFPISYDEQHTGIVLTVQDRLGARNIGVTTNASPDGHPHIRVKTGLLVIRTYDMAAVQCASPIPGRRADHR